jgi:murein peptide amidase A
VTIKINPMPAMPLLAEPPPWNAAPAPPAPEALGHSVLGNAVNLFGARRANLLVIAGVHGDESEGIFLAHLLLGAGCPAPLIPCVNPDGALLRQRWNRHNVDLNRNLPTPDWRAEATNPRYPPGSAPASEPETKAFLAALERVRPSTVLSLHSYKETFVESERPQAELSAGLNAAVADYAAAAGIERRQSIGYPTPGALGAYGRAQGLLVLTYELERGRSHGELEPLAGPLLELVRRLDAERFTAP